MPPASSTSAFGTSNSSPSTLTRTVSTAGAAASTTGAGGEGSPVWTDVSWDGAAASEVAGGVSGAASGSIPRSRQPGPQRPPQAQEEKDRLFGLMSLGMALRLPK